MIKILIDPGHGGSDRANRGKNGYVEADGVLKISKYLKAELEKTGHFKVDLTRNSDQTLSLTTRGKMAKGYDMFISEHTNAYNSITGGTEVFYSVDLPNDKALAAKMSKEIATALGIKDRGAKTNESKKYPGEDYYTVIDTAQDIGCPHVFLVEAAYHDNPAEEALLLQDSNLLKIAQAQTKVICEFYKVKPLNELEAAIKILNSTKPPIINSRDYWLENSQAGKTIKGEFAAQLILNMAKHLGQ